MPAQRKTAPPQLMTMQDAAASLIVDVRTLRRWIADGRLPAFRVGGAIRLRRSDVEALLMPIPSAADQHRRPR